MMLCRITGSLSLTSGTGDSFVAEAGPKRLWNGLVS